MKTPVLLTLALLVATPLLASDRALDQAAAAVDRVVQAGLTKAGQKANFPCSDEEFVRRIYLEAAGRIPTEKEVLQFLADTAPDKRAQLIDKLVDSAGYRSQMFDWTGDLLRVTDKLYKSGQTFVYQEWIKDEIAQNAPWDKMVSDMLTARGHLLSDGPAGYLLRDPGMPLDNLSATMTAFLGTNIGCAQCHNHPLAPWTQKEFYEMAAFFGNITTKDPDLKSEKRKANKLHPEIKDELGKNGLKQLLFENGAAVEAVPGKTLKFPDDYKYDDAKPGSPVMPALLAWNEENRKSPAYQIDLNNPDDWQKGFAAWMTSPENPRFATNIANRLWKKAFGIAVQEPVVDIDDPAKASNPELLALLTTEMKQMHFDLRQFQAMIYRTQAWQHRASVTPDIAKGAPYLFPGPVLRRLSAEQAWDSVLTLAVGTDLDNFLLHRADALRKLELKDDKLTPENLAAKADELGGHKGMRVRARGNYESESGGAGKPPSIGGLTIARASELEQPSPEAHFLRNFGQSDRKTENDSSLEGGIPQALMLMNGEIEKVVGSTRGLAFKDASARKSQQEQVTSLYLSFLARRPTSAEMATAQAALHGGMTLADVEWALFNSREFMFLK